MRRVKDLFSRRRLIRYGLGIIGLAVGTLLVVALREATLSTHDEEIEAGSRTEIVVSGRTRNAEANQTVDEMVEAQLQACRLEVSSDLDGPIEPVGGNHYRAVLVPELDDTNRRQFRGCLEDWVIDGVLVDVVSVVDHEADDALEVDDDTAEEDDD